MFKLKILKNTHDLKITSFLIINLIVISGFQFVFGLDSENSTVNATLIIVDLSGDGDYLTIQEAIDQADPGDIIKVMAGTYVENITINKTLNLIGAGSESTVIYYNGTEAIFSIEADRCNITGFTFTGIGSYAVLSLESDYNTIWDCRCIGNVIGIALKSSNHNVIKNCTCEFNSGAGIYIGNSSNNSILASSCINSTYGTGIYLFNSWNNIMQNGVCEQNAGDGIYAYWLSNGNRIINYSCNNNQGNGVYLFDSDYFNIENSSCEENGVNGFIIGSTGNSIRNCKSISNGANGFYLYHSDGSEIIDSLCSKNGRKGLYLRYSDDNIIINNSIVSNKDHGLKLGSNSGQNLINFNDFVNNNNNNNGTVQALDKGNENYWDYHGFGNYWWDYSYFYPNASNDGQLWNISYEIPPNDSTQDLFPLSTPRNTIEIEQLHPGILNDSDSEGIFDLIDAFPNNQKEWMDTDHDGIGNNADPDDDNDGLTDHDELELGTDPLLNDTDGDNYDDKTDMFPLDSTKWDEDVGEKVENKTDTDSSWPWLLVGVIIIIVVMVLIILFIVRQKRDLKSKDGKKK